MSWNEQIEKNKAKLAKQLEVLKQACSGFIEKIETDQGDCPVVWSKKGQNISLLKTMKENVDLSFEFLSDQTAYDDVDGADEAQGRFVVVYNLFSLQYKTRIRVKCRLAENEEIETAVSLWEAANWAEREVYDMFGIQFKNHPDLRRILMDVRWQGHPLRKDYHWRKYQLFNDPEPIPMKLLQEGLE